MPLNKSPSSFRSIRVYRLVDPGRLISNKESIHAALFGFRAPSGNGELFSVHPTSGYLFYSNYSYDEGRGDGGGLPPTSKDVERIAKGFLEVGNKRIVASPKLRQAGVPPLFPTDLRPVSIGVVGGGRTSSRPHWICIFSAFLAAGIDRTARVEGATIEVRVGNRGKVIGLNSRWRPVLGDLLTGELNDEASPADFHTRSPMEIVQPPTFSVSLPAKPAASQGTVLHLHNGGGALPAPHVHSNELDEVGQELVYNLPDDREAVSFLVPMRLSIGGHHGTLTPASRHSLSVEIFERASSGSLELMADVRGGSGKFRYAWGWSEIDDFIRTNEQRLGSSAAVRLTPGSRHVTVKVLDLLTGVSATCERMVVALGGDQ